ncbi:site-specific integrase [Francisella marina]|uniref:site-specific integrase n=1 Tax=Francisella marina TaxID=2249302 RepID=UPI00165DEFA1|nr:site-specific integrase [Francisella marina]
MKLTKSSIANITPADKTIDYYDSEVKGLILRVSKTGVMSFRLRYTLNKKTKLYTIGQLGAITLLQAKTEAQRLNVLIAQGIDIVDKKKQDIKDAQSITYGEYLEEFYFKWFKNNHKSWKKNNSWLKYVCHDLYKKDIDYVNNKNNISKYLNTLKESKHWSNATTNRVLAMIKGSISRAVEYGYIDKNNLSNYKKLPVKSENIRYLHDDETIRFFDNIDNVKEPYKTIILFAYYTGMRKSEILTLSWEDINHVSKSINIKAHKTKTNKSRDVPIHSKLWLEIEKMKIKKHGLIFTKETGEDIKHFEKQWRCFKKKAEIENFRFHDLRHNFCSMLVMKGVPIYTVAQLAGHSDVKTTQIYAHLSPDVKKSAVDMI